ncbi:Beta-catenin-like protein 1 [Fulvia fulva]|nr:Beta-catenin-like protein 1 [Fulvia fulva]KAK4619215.1 Beta-catenin-like protein 1 [Fulvia fulva]WPV18074.1 Beta-catenin-like protein 1 [Fulvia fulva]WPV33019.1 Beta-catenin-like protein 1 [Fulvia fulva]
MTSVDELFRKPNLPTGSHKRKLEVPDADAAYKATKLTSTSSPNGNGNHASVEDEEDDDQEAGPELPPDDDGDDEEGRFFGTGMSNDTSEALNYIDEQDGEEVYQEEKIDSAWLRRLCTSFEKKVKKNAELRARYEAEPAKFIDSEADLDAEIKSWSLLSEHPELYGEFAEAESAVTSLVGLLAHENTDIAIGAIEIVAELLDEDVQAEQEQWDALVIALLEADLLDLLMSNLARLDEENETDRSGVYHSLAVLENLGGQQAVAERIGQEKVLNWLCERIGKPEKPLGQNKQYAAEVLQVLLQSSSILRKRLAVDIDGVDLFLQVLAAYRKRDPAKDSHEEEYVENVFDALTCVVDEAEGKAKFVAAEGVELMLIMLKEGTKNISQRALRVLDHAVGGQGTEATAVCETIIQAAGLKTLFSRFMKKSDHSTVEHLLGIFSALLRLLPGESAPRIRTLAKFSEKDYEKITKLLKLRTDYAAKVAAVDSVIKEERKGLDAEEVEDREAEWFSRRLEGGLFCLQMVSVALAWLIAEDTEIRRRVSAELGDLTTIRESLEAQKAGLEVEDEDTKEMLETLISFL